MAVNVFRSGSMVNASTYKEFVVDFLTEVPDLPTTPDKVSVGSKAVVVEDASVWMLNGQGEWVDVSGDGGKGFSVTDLSAVFGAF